ncbi:hypothetical protein ABH944_008566 [Caballeronia udeis]|uniref:Uncharacterized protein n=1 Tax=Caballeronia udeis TaxID=1232866 RepID=A0ABW8N1D1_9BURK
MAKTPPTPKLAYDLAQARAVIEAGGILSATLTAEGGFWHVDFVTREAGLAQFVTDRRERRQFGRSDLALRVLRRIGLTRASVDMVGLNISSAPAKRWTRPDAAAEMSAAHEAKRSTGMRPKRVARPKKDTK